MLGNLGIEILCKDSVKHASENNRKFDLVFMDPPFNIGHGYETYDDVMESSEFDRWLTGATVEAFHSLRDGGILALHGPDKLAKTWIKTESLLWNPVSWVNWTYNFGQCHRNSFIDGRCHLLVYSRGKPFTWNPDSVLIPSLRASKYNDKRCDDYEKGGTRVPSTIWGSDADGRFWGRVQGNSKERWKKSRGALANHPNQLPELYIARIIKAYTNPGDLVFDMFAGSGTVPVVCNALQRRCVACDVCEKCVRSIHKRVERGAVRL